MKSEALHLKVRGVAMWIRSLRSEAPAVTRAAFDTLLLAADALALPSAADAKEIRAAFGNLGDAALAGLAGATPEQIDRIEQFILRECYPMHVDSRGK